MNKIELIENAIENGINRKSKLSMDALMVPALTSLNIRHMLNNLGAISNIVLDSGSHRGGSFCSMVYGNENITTAISIDSWASDHMQGEVCEIDFRLNAERFTPKSTNLVIIKSDTFDVNVSKMPHGIDLYYFDASHDEDSQRKALTYYIDAMADEFIFCVDDYMLDDVKIGTEKGLIESGVEILFEREFVTNHEYDNESFWRGWKIFLLKKKDVFLNSLSV